MPMLLLTYPVIDPVLLQLGPLAIRWYALAYISGLIAGWWLIRRIVADERYWLGLPRPTPDSIDDLLVYCALGVVLGGRIGNVLFYDPHYYFAHPLEILMLWHGGMAFHGGMLGALVGVILFARRYRVPWLTVLDLACLVAPIGIFLGRIANFIKPELWGRPTDVPWAMVFPGSDGLPRHPSQLYEAVLEGALNFVVLLALARRGGLTRRGLVTGAFGVIYGLARIFCEFFRDPDPNLEKLGHGLTMGMVLSAPMVVIGLGVIVWSLRANRTST
ncbi:MAG TPA: prolipoprotein diacylglyceryl transferase [Roseiarcus sp.]|nr:prolipoprotein diacylglyceryl transferase [Roseiarcus sp.]